MSVSVCVCADLASSEPRFRHWYLSMIKITFFCAASSTLHWTISRALLSPMPPIHTSCVMTCSTQYPGISAEADWGLRSDVRSDVVSNLGLSGATGSMAFFTFSNKPDHYAMVLVASGVMGVFCFAILPLALELGVEITYPVCEGTSSGFLWMAGQFFGIIILLGMGSLKGRFSKRAPAPPRRARRPSPSVALLNRTFSAANDGCSCGGCARLYQSPKSEGCFLG